MTAIPPPPSDDDGRHAAPVGPDPDASTQSGPGRHERPERAAADHPESAPPTTRYTPPPGGRSAPPGQNAHSPGPAGESGQYNGPPYAQPGGTVPPSAGQASGNQPGQQGARYAQPPGQIGAPTGPHPAPQYAPPGTPGPGTAAYGAGNRAAQYTQSGGSQYAQPGGPQHTQPGGPQHAQPDAPQHTQPGGPQHTQPGAPQYAQPGGPQYAQPGGPSYTPPPKPARVLNVGTALRYGFDRFRANAAVWVLLTLAALVVFVVLQGGFSFAAPRDSMFAIDVSLSSVAGFLIMGVVAAIVQAVFVRGALSEVDGAKPGFRDFFRFPSLASIVLAGGLVGIATGLASLLCFLPALVVAYFAYYTFHFVFDRGQEGIAAIKSSVDLATRNFGSLAVLALACIGINLVGFVLCCVGLLATLPITFIAGAYAFRFVTNGVIAPHHHPTDS